MSSEKDKDLVAQNKINISGVGVFWIQERSLSQSQVICKTGKSVVAAKQGNTTNLFQHLRQRHKELYEQCMAKNPWT